MNLVDLSIKRPVFVTCVFSVILVVGLISLKGIGVNLYPNMTFPVVLITTIYPGAGPEEVETQVSKIMEEEISTLSGVKSIMSSSKESVSIVVVEFVLEMDIKYATQQVRDRIALIRNLLPSEIKEPILKNVDPSDLPIAVIGVLAELSDAELYDLVHDKLKNRIEQVKEVGLVEVFGSRKREIHVNLDQNKLKNYEMAASTVIARIAASGKNIPAGKVVGRESETVIRSISEYQSVRDIESTIISFMGNDVPVAVKDVAKVKDSLADEKSRSFIDGKPAVFLFVYRQSGANTVSVFDGVKNVVDKLNLEISGMKGHPSMKIVRDGAKPIKMNVDDVKEAIVLGIILTIVVVYLFLGNLRSTFITGIALPNSLLGAFILVSVAGFTINVTTLLALSLAVGLLIDDAIVVRENIFRHMGMGKSPSEAASQGAKEVALAVVATTLCIMAVFGPVAFIKGIIGRFLREFGLTICFAMLISLLDSLTMGPMLSAYLGGIKSYRKHGIIYKYTLHPLLYSFEKFQDLLSEWYGKLLGVIVRFPISIILATAAAMFLSFKAYEKIPKNFMTNADLGEFVVNLDSRAGTTLVHMTEMTFGVEKMLKSHKEVLSTVTTIGSGTSDSNVASIYVQLVPRKERSVNTSQFKEILRGELKRFSHLNPKVDEAINMAGRGRPFILNISGSDLKTIAAMGEKVKEELGKNPNLRDVDTSYRSGKPELQIILNNRKAQEFGISSAIVGGEIRSLVEGAVPAVLKDKGNNYDIRVRLKEEQRDLAASFSNIHIPNINMSLVKLSDIARPQKKEGPATIDRLDRRRYVQITADVAVSGAGLSQAKKDAEELFSSGKVKLVDDVQYSFIGETDEYKNMVEGIVLAGLLGIVLIYLVLASLYESFITPLTIMLVFPLAISGAVVALYLTSNGMDIMSMIGCVMLIGLSTKNSILLVDHANFLVSRDMPRSDAIIEAGRVRLRPILMTSIALITGMLPVAIGLSEVSSQRSGMGIAVIGGVISSTFLTLLVVPAVYSYVERFRVFFLTVARRLFEVQ
ncbi:MAG: efflux RND transporter permease subunit [Oligoflexales bacterium]|nr:efflux RND transporter permease subunit [Oligoflexales bacterium]